VKTSNRILIVDDEPNLRLVFRTSLESAEIEVEEAEDGQAALAALESREFDLVLLDLRMPILDGMQTLRLIRERGLEVPVVIITAHGSVPDAVEAMKLGAIDFLSKPVTPDALRSLVGDVLARNEPGARPGDLVSAVKLSLTRRQFDEAAALIQQAFETEAGAAELNYLRGLLLEYRGQREKALAAYRAALSADAGHQAARQRLEVLGG
jgi:DNA-binding NtrC family response regulator